MHCVYTVKGIVCNRTRYCVVLCYAGLVYEYSTEELKKEPYRPYYTVQARCIYTWGTGFRENGSVKGVK